MKTRIVPSTELRMDTLRAEDYVPDSKRARLIREACVNLKTIRVHLRKLEQRLEELEKLEEPTLCTYGSHFGGACRCGD